MSTDTKTDLPPLANLVQAGEAQTEAVKITDYLFMVRDVSNAYLITTDDGDVLVNTGFFHSPEKNKAMFDKVRTGPLRLIFLTQAHADHFGGLAVMKEPGTQVVAQRRFPETWDFFHDMRDYLGKRSGKLWGFNRRLTDQQTEIPEARIDVLVDDHQRFEVGGRTFDLLATPGGESLCSAVVWMPKEKIVFTGNLFGPVFLSVPNLNTTRGDKPRLIGNYLSSLERVRDLAADMLITGHGDPVEGADNVRAALDKMHAAMTYIRDETLTGMNAGKTVYELMRDISLPEHLKIGEFHGKVSWAVRAIWHENSGWFYYDTTAELYSVPRSSVSADLVELAGGADKLTQRAKQKLDAGQPLEAVHLLDIALKAEPGNKSALAVNRDAHKLLLERSGSANLSETMWLRAEIAAAEQALAD